jgi:hypothetical protein
VTWTGVDTITLVWLTQRKRDELARVVRNACTSVDPAGFVYAEVGGNVRQAQIDHMPSDSRCELWQQIDPPGYGISMTVGGADFRFRSTLAWEQLLGNLPDWVAEIEYNLTTPDLWEELKQVPEIVAAAQAEDASDAPFSAEERAAISGRIEEIKQQARQNPELTAEQISGIEQNLDYLVEASEHVRKKDWLMTIPGVVLGMLANDLVPQHVVQAIIATVITGLGHIFGIGGPPQGLLS